MHFDLWIVLAFAGSAAWIASLRRRGGDASTAADARAGHGDVDAGAAGSLAAAGAAILATSIALFALLPRALGPSPGPGLAARVALSLGLAAVGGALILLLRGSERSGRLAGTVGPRGRPARDGAVPSGPAGGAGGPR